jgi:hypothetical protein
VKLPTAAELRGIIIKLKQLYSKWEIIKSGNFETDLEEHNNLKPHKHQLSFILARKASLPKK